MTLVATSWLDKPLTAFALWLFVFVTAVAVVYATYSSRSAFVESQELSAEVQRLDVHWGRLLIEQSNSSSVTRIEGIATEKLEMSVPDAGRVIVLQGGD